MELTQDGVFGVLNFEAGSRSWQEVSCPPSRPSPRWYIPEAVGSFDDRQEIINKVVSWKPEQELNSFTEYERNLLGVCMVACSCVDEHLQKSDEDINGPIQEFRKALKWIRKTKKGAKTRTKKRVVTPLTKTYLGRMRSGIREMYDHMCNGARPGVHDVDWDFLGAISFGYLSDPWEDRPSPGDLTDTQRQVPLYLFFLIRLLRPDLK